MAFAQLTDRANLRDLKTCLRSLPGKLYHQQSPVFSNEAKQPESDVRCNLR
jgi:hypothetical protein